MVVRRFAPVIVTLLVGVSIALGAPSAAQSPGPSPAASASGDACRVSLEELNELSGLRFVSTAGGPSNCFYDSDPAEAFYTLELRIEPPDPTAVEPPEDGLLVVRITYEDGRDTTVAGLPAWESPHGIWVDVGDDVLVVQPILSFMADPPDPRGFLAPVAELAVSRLRASER